MHNTVIARTHIPFCQYNIPGDEFIAVIRPCELAVDTVAGFCHLEVFVFLHDDFYPIGEHLYIHDDGTLPKRIAMIVRDAEHEIERLRRSL